MAGTKNRKQVQGTGEGTVQLRSREDHTQSARVANRTVIFEGMLRWSHLRSSCLPEEDLDKVVFVLVGRQDHLQQEEDKIATENGAERGRHAVGSALQQRQNTQRSCQLQIQSAFHSHRESGTIKTLELDTKFLDVAMSEKIQERKSPLASVRRQVRLNTKIVTSIHLPGYLQANGHNALRD